MNGQVEQVGALQGLIERNPTAFLASLLATAVLGAVFLWVRAVLRIEKLQRLHAKELNGLQKEHSERVDAIRLAELERAITFQHLVAGFVRVVEQGGIKVKPGRRAPPTTSPSKLPQPGEPLILRPEDVSNADDEE